MHAFPFRPLLDESKCTDDAEYRCQLHDASSCTVGFGSQCELALHALDEPADFAAARLGQHLEVALLLREVATVLLVCADLLLLAAWPRRRGCWQPLSEPAHQCIEQHHDIAA